MSDDALIDYEWRAIRIAEVRADGFVAFDFYVGDPDIYAEMVLPLDAFHEFCATQGVEPTGPEDHAVSADGLGFSLRDAAAHAADSKRTSDTNIPNQGNNHAA
jgi:phenol/toluene 2-monooxygenase (NADH) P0/A0